VVLDGPVATNTSGRGQGEYRDERADRPVRFTLESLDQTFEQALMVFSL
jgi:hypothetical protein